MQMHPYFATLIINQRQQEFSEQATLRRLARKNGHSRRRLSFHRAPRPQLQRPQIPRAKAASPAPCVTP
jgi:hypothetical protein